MAAAERALANRHIVSNILHQLSDMKYKVKRQFGPDQPVEFLEFRPTLVPSILVNKLWADEGTSVLWENYPHLPALSVMEPDRKQYYANKVRKIFTMSPPIGSPTSLEHLRDLRWPKLKSLEMDVDFARHGDQIRTMMHPALEYLELSGYQSEGAEYFKSFVLPTIFGPCEKLKSIRFGAGIVNDEDVLSSSFLQTHLEWTPGITHIEIKTDRFTEKDSLFYYLSHRPGLEELEIDLEPGTLLVPVIEDVTPPLFNSLKSLTLMCYPEVALALLKHLGTIECLQLDLCRIPDHPLQDSDKILFDTLLSELSNCARLKQLKIGIGALATSFPSADSLPVLSGTSLVKLSSTCHGLTHINLFAMEPSAIDGSRISNEDFETFCSNLPLLQSLCLKLHPPTASSFVNTAIQTLGKHCPELEVLRLKIPLDLTRLPVPESLPGASPQTPTQEHPDAETTEQPDLATSENIHNLEASNHNHPVQGPGIQTGMDRLNLSRTNSIPPNITLNGHDLTEQDLAQSMSTARLHINTHFIQPSNTPASDIKPLFPRLTHLAICRPQTLLASAADTFSSSGSAPIDPLIEETLNPPPEDILDPATEEALVRSWALPLRFHFPSLEILEAWGDWVGEDNESLNYFLPAEEMLASTWEFLSGVEQDLWDDEEDEEEANWISYEGDSGTGDYFGDVDVYDDGAYYQDHAFVEADEDQLAYNDKEAAVDQHHHAMSAAGDGAKGDAKVGSFIGSVEPQLEEDLTPRIPQR